LICLANILTPAETESDAIPAPILTTVRHRRARVTAAAGQMKAPTGYAKMPVRNDATRPATMTEALSKEETILRMLKRVLTDIAKDTSTPPGMKHPLSENTIQGIRDCLALIAAREKELATDSGRPSASRPEFIDEPKKTHVVTLHKPKKKPDSDKPH